MKIMVRMRVPWSMITVFQIVFQNYGGDNSQACGMQVTSDSCRCDPRDSGCKSYVANKDVHALFRTSDMKDSSTALIAIFVLALPASAPWSRCDVRIHALNRIQKQ